MLEVDICAKDCLSRAGSDATPATPATPASASAPASAATTTHPYAPLPLPPPGIMGRPVPPWASLNSARCAPS